MRQVLEAGWFSCGPHWKARRWQHQVDACPASAARLQPLPAAPTTHRWPAMHLHPCCACCAAVAIEDEIMAVPPEDMFAGPGPTPRKTPGKTPLSAGGAPLPGLSDMRITPPSLPGGADLLPDIGATGASGGTTGGDGGFPGGMYDEEAGAPVLLPLDLEAAAEEAGEAAAATEAGAAAAGQVQQVAARRRAAATGPRRRKPTVDSGRDGRPATTLPSGEIRSLLADRKPLLTRRGRRTRRRGAVAPPGMFDVVSWLCRAE